LKVAFISFVFQYYSADFKKYLRP